MNDLSGLKHLIEMRMQTLTPEYLNISHGDISFIQSFCQMILTQMNDVKYYSHFEEFALRTLSKINELREA